MTPKNLPTDPENPHQVQVDEETRTDKKAQEANKDDQTRTAVLRTVIILSMIIVILMGMILTIRFVPRSITSLPSAFQSIVDIFQGKEKLTLSTDATNIESGTIVNLKISHTHITASSTGSYTLSYPCLNGFHFEQVGVPGGNNYLNCATNVTVSKDTPIQLIPVSAISNLLDVPVTAFYTPSGAANPSLSTTLHLTVVNEQLNYSTTTPTKTATSTPAPVVTKPAPATTTPVTPKPTTQNPQPTTKKPASPANLVIHIIGTGTIDPITGQFSYRQPQSPFDRAAVRFSIFNNGDSPSANYSFSATLPSNSTPNYYSPLEDGLRAQHGMFFTLGFNNFMPNNPVVTIRLGSQQVVTRFGLIQY